MLARIIGKTETLLFVAIDEDEGEVVVTKGARDASLELGDYIVGNLLEDGDGDFCLQFSRKAAEEEIEKKRAQGGYEHLFDDSLVRKI